MGSADARPPSPGPPPHSTRGAGLRGQEPLFLPWVRGPGRGLAALGALSARPSLFMFERSPGWEGSWNTAVSVHVFSSLAPSPSTLLPAFQGPGGCRGPGWPCLATRRPCMSTAPYLPSSKPGSACRTQGSGHLLFARSKGEGGGLGEEQSPPACVPCLAGARSFPRGPSGGRGQVAWVLFFKIK